LKKEERNKKKERMPQQIRDIRKFLRLAKTFKSKGEKKIIIYGSKKIKSQNLKLKQPKYYTL